MGLLGCSPLKFDICLILTSKQYSAVCKQYCTKMLFISNILHAIFYIKLIYNTFYKFSFYFM